MRNWMIVGVIATGFIALALPIYGLLESSRMQAAHQELLNETIAEGQVIYAENCAMCHGAAGEGIGSYVGLDNPGVETMEYDTLFKVIERGRDGTDMGAWGKKEGGVLNNWQIDQLISMIQQGDWAETAYTVEQLGFDPPTMVETQITTETLASLTNLPHGELLARAVPVYAANCAGCHGASGQGTALAPAVNDGLANYDDEALRRIIASGVPGTLMSSWKQTLSAAEIDDQVGLIRYWQEIPAGSLAEAAPPAIASTDAETLAEGQRLYGVVCASCHGLNGEGRPMAPALNTQSYLGETNDQAIRAIILQGIPETRMPAWGGRLTDREVNAIVSYMRSWEATAPAVAEPMQGRQMGRGPRWMRDNNGDNQGQGGGWSLWQWLW